MATRLDVLLAHEPGKSISVPYQDSEPIFFLIDRIANSLDQENDKFRKGDLYIGGIRLRDLCQSMATYRIFGNGVTYKTDKQLATVGTFTDKVITVKTITGKTILLRYCPQDTIACIRQKAMQEEDSMGQRGERLIFAGKSLEDSRTLEDYNITHGSVIFMLSRMLGGGGDYLPEGFLFSDVSDVRAVRKVEFSISAPPGRRVRPGTNVECRCDCTPGYLVICPEGLGVIELSQAKLRCPNCRQFNKIVPITVGFTRCKYRFHGIKKDGKQYTSDWKEVTSNDSYQLFSAENQTAWRRLVIESVDLNARDICTICLYELDTSKKLACGHCFHDSCFAKWKSSCPNCRFNQHLLH